MTQEEIRTYYAKQVEWYKKEIEWDTREIEWETRNIRREKESIEKLRDYVWGKGVLTRDEMRIWGDKNYKTPDAVKAENRRRKLYIRRKKDKEQLAKYEKLLETV